MDARQIACVGAAAFVGAMLVTATASMARPVRPVVISKHIDPMTRYVSYADLSLTTREGKDRFYQRVGQAVNDVCPNTLSSGDQDSITFYDRTYCKNYAWHGAAPQMRKAIRAAEVGMPLIMTLGVTGAQK